DHHRRPAASDRRTHTAPPLSPPPTTRNNHRLPASTTTSVGLQHRHTRCLHSFSRSHEPPTYLEQFGISSRRHRRRSRAVVSSSLTSPRRRCLKARNNLSLPCRLQ
ncbi:hypothetical protein PIB30_106275, partial [Stylosanthes scabra]|nr:hypothetical protein [Stylosanthes scabra]